MQYWMEDLMSELFELPDLCAYSLDEIEEKRGQNE